MTHNTPEPPFELTQAELNSSVWKKIEGHLEKRLESHRRRNDASLDERKTEKLRGKISEVKQLLGLNDPANQSNEPEG